MIVWVNVSDHFFCSGIPPRCSGKKTWLKMFDRL